jgi:hypothetical protein
LCQPHPQRWRAPSTPAPLTNLQLRPSPGFKLMRDINRSLQR